MTLLFSVYENRWLQTTHKYEECQTQSAKILALAWEGANKDDFNDILQTMCEFQVMFPLLSLGLRYSNPKPILIA